MRLPGASAEASEVGGEVAGRRRRSGVSAPGPPPPIRPRFVRNFMDQARDIPDALERFVTDVRERRFPAPEHSYQ